MSGPETVGAPEGSTVRTVVRPLEGMQSLPISSLVKARPGGAESRAFSAPTRVTDPTPQEGDPCR